MTQDERHDRLERLLGYLAHDPGNATLAFECAEAALEADLPAKAGALLAGLAEAGALDAAGENLAGIAAMRAGDQARAQAHFESLLAQRPEDPALRFNLAWSRALAGDTAGAADMLDPGAVEALPQAAMLDLQLAHQQGAYDEARGKMEVHLARHPDYPPLQAAASVLAMDLGEAELARACAAKAGEHPDALATLAALDLGDGRPDQARARFRQSLAAKQVNPRAHIGLGLAELAGGASQQALPHLDAGAEQFGDHLGSWIAAGWAHCLAGDTATARARFERALALDDTFAESHGSLAALDVMAGDFETAKRRMEVALRLDRRSFSAALAGVLLASAEGDKDKAARLFQAAASQPLTYDGKTLIEALARSAL